ncbi:ABC transporter substrate-binding protein [Roseibium salinum]|uniref:ABC transporter substrate-binding protein n=2 Tax=Roseibium salinum TaxID=1604349 RepID=A0ABT3R9V7_9HYPH|nr:ABC transporter substrate-binding protein [Roseibium sp. DSM 29163]MCX2725801.1 ABC transporter substrate-binding protein [Roseibium sp. DSM 29163]
MQESIAQNEPENGTVKSRRKVWIAVLLSAAVIVLVVAVLEAAGVTSMLNRLTGSVTALFKDEDDSLTIVAVYSEDGQQSNFLRGAEMAVSRVNENDQGVLGRKLNLKTISEPVYLEDRGLETAVEDTLKLSGRIAKTKNLLAVVGHEWSDTAVTASSIYNLNDVLYFATHATADSLTNHSFDTVFALQPDNSTNSGVVATYALKSGLRRFIVLSDKTDYGMESANFFMASTTTAGADIVYRGYLSSNRQSTEQLLMFILDNQLFKRTDFDALFIVSSSLDATGDFIKSARELGLDVPILGMEYMFSSTLERLAGKKNMKNVAGVSLFDRDDISKDAQAFVSDFSGLYGQMPDLDAALGYDAIMLVRDVANKAGTTEPDKVADTLKIARYKTPFKGVTGPLIFDRNGLITDTEVFIVQHDGKEFHTVETYQIPTDWAKVSQNKLEDEGTLDTLPTGVTAPAEEQADQ